MEFTAALAASVRLGLARQRDLTDATRKALEDLLFGRASFGKWVALARAAGSELRSTGGRPERFDHGPNLAAFFASLELLAIDNLTDQARRASGGSIFDAMGVFATLRNKEAHHEIHVDRLPAEVVETALPAAYELASEPSVLLSRQLFLRCKDGGAYLLTGAGRTRRHDPTEPADPGLYFLRGQSTCPAPLLCPGPERRVGFFSQLQGQGVKYVDPCSGHTNLDLRELEWIDGIVDRTQIPDPGDTRHGAVFLDFVVREKLGGTDAIRIDAATHIPLSRSVVLERIQLDAFGLNSDHIRARRYIAEIAGFADLRHDHLVSIYDHGTEGDVLWLAREELDGKPLADVEPGELEPSGTRTPWQELAAAMVGPAEGVHALHERGIVHRDIRPESCVIDPANRVFLLHPAFERDMGACAAPEVTRRPTEQLAHDQRVDVYALGAVIREARPDASGMPRDLRTIVLRATADDPTQRYSTAQDLAADLRRFAEGERVHTRRPGVISAASRFVEQCRKTAVAAVIVTLSLVTSFFLFWRDADARSVENAELLRETSSVLDNEARGVAAGVRALADQLGVIGRQDLLFGRDADGWTVADHLRGALATRAGDSVQRKLGQAELGLVLAEAHLEQRGFDGALHFVRTARRLLEDPNDRSTIRLRTKVAAMEGRALWGKGELEAAEESFRRALAVMDTARETPPIKFDRAGLHGRFSELLLERKKLDEAARHADLGIEELRELVALGNPPLVTRCRLIGAEMWRGHIEWRWRGPSSARQLMESALANAIALGANSKSSVDVDATLAECHESLARLDLAEGRTKAALDHARKAIVGAGRVLKASPQSVRAALQLVEAENCAAATLSDGPVPTASLAHSENALRLLAARHASSPRHFEVHLALAHQRLSVARTAASAGQRKRARDLARQATGDFQSLLELSPDDSLRVASVEANVVLGRLNVILGDAERGLELLRTAIGLCESLGEYLPVRKKRVHAEAHAVSSQCLRFAGSIAPAEKHARRAVSILEQTAKEQPDAEIHSELAQAMRELAEVHLAANRMKDAIASLESAIRMLGRVIAKPHSSIYESVMLRAARRNLVELRSRLGGYEGVLETSREDARFFAGLRASDPESATWILEESRCELIEAAELVRLGRLVQARTLLRDLLARGREMGDDTEAVLFRLRCLMQFFMSLQDDPDLRDADLSVALKTIAKRYGGMLAECVATGNEIADRWTKDESPFLRDLSAVARLWTGIFATLADKPDRGRVEFRRALAMATKWQVWSLQVGRVRAASFEGAGWIAAHVLRLPEYRAFYDHAFDVWMSSYERVRARSDLLSAFFNRRYLAATLRAAGDRPASLRVLQDGRTISSRITKAGGPLADNLLREYLLLLRIGDLQRSLLHTEGGLATSRALLDVATKLKEIRSSHVEIGYVATAHSRLAGDLAKTEKHETAIEHYRAARELQVVLLRDERRWESVAMPFLDNLVGLARAAKRLKKTGVAKRAAEEAWDFIDSRIMAPLAELKNPHLLHHGAMALALFENMHGDPERAITLFEHALKLCRMARGGDLATKRSILRDLLNVRGFLAQAVYRQRQFDRARQLLTEAVEDLRSLEKMAESGVVNPFELHRGLRDLAGVAEKMDSTETAVNLARKAVYYGVMARAAIGEDPAVDLGLIESFRLVASGSRSMGQRDHSWESVQKGMELLRGLAPRQLAGFNARLARVAAVQLASEARELGRHPAMKQLYDLALSFSPDPGSRAYVHLMIAFSHQRLGSSNDAKKSFRIVTQLVETIPIADRSVFEEWHYLEALIETARVEEARAPARRLRDRGWQHEYFLELCKRHGLLDPVPRKRSGK